MPESIFPTQGGRYEIDSKGNLKQVEAPTQDPTYDRGEASAPAPVSKPPAAATISNDEAAS
jgi:hypothetical protein